MFGSLKTATLEDFSRHVAELKDKGFGGFITYLQAPPQFATSPAFAHLLKEAERHKLLMGSNNCGMWPAGGPWISLGHHPWATVSSTMDLEGGKRFHGKLPEPALPADYDGQFRRQLQKRAPSFQEWVRLGIVDTVAVLRLPAARTAAAVGAKGDGQQPVPTSAGTVRRQLEYDLDTDLDVTRRPGSAPQFALGALRFRRTARGRGALGGWPWRDFGALGRRR